MIKLNITLGNSIFRQYYLPYSDDFADVLKKVSAHKTVLSERLINYYTEEAAKVGLKDACQTRLQSVINNNQKCILVGNYGKGSIQDEMVAIADGQPFRILLAEVEEIARANRRIKLLRCHDVISDKGCVLNLYTMPVVARYIPPHKRVEEYSQWLKNWMKGEKKITIRDSYFFTAPSLLSFREHFFPLFDSGIEIEVQVDEEAAPEALAYFDRPEFVNNKTSVYLCEKMHERVLIFNDFQIVIGKGVTVFSGDWNLTGESFVTISEKTVDFDTTKIKRLR